MKSKDRMIRAIRSRKDLEPTVISLKKLLASGGMEHYLDLCSYRLADELMIDGEDTKFNFADLPDILFTESGLFDCRHILENYLSVDALMDAWQLLLGEERIKREVNSVATAFREMKLRKLLRMYKNHKSSKSGETGQLVRKWIMWEMWSRTPVSGIWRKVREILARIHVRVKYKWLFDMVSSAAEKYNGKSVAGT